MKVLLIEDDRAVIVALRQALRNSYYVETAENGLDGMQLAEDNKYDAILLDLGLPDISGLRLCQRLRDKHITTPIIVRTGDAASQSIIKLLDAGADDYLTKPFRVDELKARLRALTRRLPQAGRKGILTVGGLVLDQARRTVTRDGIPIDLRKKEFTILEYLMAHAGLVVTRNALLNYAWNDEDNIWTNTVDVHIKYLRDKLDKPFNESLITTVHGVGYKLERKSVARVPA